MKKIVFETPAIETETIESLSAKLLAANAELRHVQKDREEMLSNISHDLRAPLAAIRSSLDYLRTQKNISAEESEKLLALIDRRTQTLENLIQDMYYLFCVEDTSREMQLETIEAAPFLEEYYYDLLADSRFDSHDMCLELSPSLSCQIRVDVQKLVRVLDNLFTNAVKYTPADSRITLHAEMQPICDPADFPKEQLLISVLDNGNGISAADLPHIFNRTYTVSAARTPGASGGSGLGLAIAKAIVERHGGSITCESKVGEGCRFLISLPALTPCST
mgnify:CR=1 FL=1